MKKLIIVVFITTLALAGCTSKPSKESVRDAFRENLIEQSGATSAGSDQDNVEKFADCIVDEVYDKLSAKTAKKFVDAKSTDEFNEVSGTQEEKSALDSAAETCAADTIAPAGE